MKITLQFDLENQDDRAEYEAIQSFKEISESLSNVYEYLSELEYLIELKYYPKDDTVESVYNKVVERLNKILKNIE